jgi:predicted small lipoprotein YifL
MKKFLAIMLALVLLLTLAACGDKNNGGETPSGNDTEQTTDTPTEAPTENKVEEKEIAEKLEGVGSAKLYNSYMELVIPEGYGYKITDANTQAGESQFWIAADIMNADGKKIGELNISNTGSFDNVDEYVNYDRDYYKDSSSITLGETVSAEYGILDGRYFTKDTANWVDYNFYGYYLIPDEAADYRNVRAELDINGYYYTDVEFPMADFEAIMSSIVIK